MFAYKQKIRFVHSGVGAGEGGVCVCGAGGGEATWG